MRGSAIFLARPAARPAEQCPKKQPARPATRAENVCVTDGNVQTSGARSQQEPSWSGGAVLAARNGGKASLQAAFLFFLRERDGPRPARSPPIELKS